MMPRVLLYEICVGVWYGFLDFYYYFLNSSIIKQVVDIGEC